MLTQTIPQYSYWAYGLNFKSELEIPELTVADASADVSIRVGRVNDSPASDELERAPIYRRPGCTVKAAANAFCYDWNGIGKILIRNGREVVVEPQPGVEKSELSPFIIGTAIAVLLYQRGLMVLHASAVEINGVCVAFVGNKGAGKSTFAAYLQSRGHRLVSDDIIPIDFANGMRIVPGYPRIRLWADTLESFGVNPETLPRVASFMNKRTYGCSDNFSTESVKLRALYALSENDEIGFEKLPPTAAFIEIARHTYLNRYLESTERSAEHFAQCQQLVKFAPVFEFKRPRIYKQLSEVAAALENHVRKIADSGAVK